MRICAIDSVIALLGLRFRERSRCPQERATSAGNQPARDVRREGSPVQPSSHLSLASPGGRDSFAIHQCPFCSEILLSCKGGGVETGVRSHRLALSSTLLPGVTAR